MLANSEIIDVGWGLPEVRGQPTGPCRLRHPDPSLGSLCLIFPVAKVLLQPFNGTWDSFPVCVRQQPAALDFKPSLPPTPPLEQAAGGMVLHFPEDSEEAEEKRGGAAGSAAVPHLQGIAEPHSLLSSSGSLSEDSAGWGVLETVLMTGVSVGAKEPPVLGPGSIHMCSGWFCRQRMNSPTGWPS